MHLNKGFLLCLIPPENNGMDLMVILAQDHEGTLNAGDAVSLKTATDEIVIGGGFILKQKFFK